MDIYEKMVDLNTSVSTNINSAQNAMERKNTQDKTTEVIGQLITYKFAKAEQDRKNLDKLAKNSEEANDSLREINRMLKEKNELLTEQNQQLNNKLEEINRILNLLLNCTDEGNQDSKELKMQANALLCEISVTLDKGEKVDLKEKLADCSANVISTAFVMYLQSKGLLP